MLSNMVFMWTLYREVMWWGVELREKEYGGLGRRDQRGQRLGLGGPVGGYCYNLEWICRMRLEGSWGQNFLEHYLSWGLLRETKDDWRVQAQTIAMVTGPQQPCVVGIVVPCFTDEKLSRLTRAKGGNISKKEGWPAAGQVLERCHADPKPQGSGR